MFEVKLNIILLHFYITEKFIQVQMSTHNKNIISVLVKEQNSVISVTKNSV